MLAFPILADENVDMRVVSALRESGAGIVAVSEALGCGLDDASVLRWAHAHGRVVLTHDSDFGTLAMHLGASFVGILYVRPGDLRPPTVIEVIDAVGRIDADVRPPFVVVAERRSEGTRVRIRERA